MLRHLLSILLLPFVVVVVVPYLLLTTDAASGFRWQNPSLAHGGRVLGSVVGVAGLVLFIWCVVLFARVGKGTLAPWDPTRRLVATGPYRYVRNPMILAVAIMLAGQALFFGSVALAAWCAVFAIVNHVYFLAIEEPGLERRFGEPYREYQRRVPRWLPRLRRRDEDPLGRTSC